MRRVLPPPAARPGPRALRAALLAAAAVVALTSLRGLARSQAALAWEPQQTQLLPAARGPEPAPPPPAMRENETLGEGTAEGESSEEEAADRARLRQLLAAWPVGKPRAALLALARNGEAAALAASMAELEARSNALPGRRYQPFTRQFREVTANATTAPCFYGRIPAAHWGYPPWINQTLAAEARADMERRNVLYGGLESYHHMCRWFSGFFFRHPLLEGFDFYWRVEPGVYFTCTLPDDPFRYMQDHNISLSWVIINYEILSTIPSLWPAVREYLLAHPEALAPNNSLPGLIRGSLEQGHYAGVHFWSNFEIGDLRLFRGGRYRSLFEHLDRAGGFFYERWGDAPVHTLAAGALLDRSRIHRFSEIGYQHGDWEHCPAEPALRPLCDCNPRNDVNLHQWGALAEFQRAYARDTPSLPAVTIGSM